MANYGDLDLDESDIQAITLALAKLSIERPGWEEYLGEIAEKFGMAPEFAAFRRTDIAMRRLHSEKGLK